MKILSTLFFICFFLSMSFAQKNPPYTYILKIDCAGSGLEKTGTLDKLTVRFYKKDGTLINQKLFKYNGHAAGTQLNDAKCNSNAFDDMHFSLDYPNMDQGGYGILSTIAFHLDYRISYFTIEIDGNDAFWLDQVLIFRWDKRTSRDFPSKLDAADKIYRWGQKNGKGWCFSTDPNDSKRGFKDYIGSVGCQPCFKYTLSDQKAVRCN